MKEETNETATTSFPSEAEMNDMHKNAWLDFQADAQAAKQELNRRYAMMLKTYGTYKDMPYGVKELVKQDYNTHEAKWGEHGEEQQKRFGAKEPGTAQDQKKPEQAEPEYKSLADEKEAYLAKIQQTRELTQSHKLEYEL